jgi:hypothetical protein
MGGDFGQVTRAAEANYGPLFVLRFQLALLLLDGLALHKAPFVELRD